MAERILITGKSIATAKQMAAALDKNNPNPKIKISSLELAQLFIEEGNIENVRGDIAFAQGMKETGWLKYGGQVLPDQNNYCGLGATNNSPIGKGAWFDTERLGVRAQIQHLVAYANKETLNTELIDPRFKLVTRGIAPHWEDLNGRWAVPGIGYGESIIEIFNKILKIVIEEDPIPEVPVIDNSKELNELKVQIDEMKKQIIELKSTVDQIKVDQDHLKEVTEEMTKYKKIVNQIEELLNK